MRANPVLFLLLVFMFSVVDGHSAVSTSNALAAAVVTAPENAKALKKQQKKEKRLRNLVDKIEKKIEKRMAKKGVKATNGVWENSKFRLGVYVGLGAIALSIIGGLVGGSIFWILASLAWLAAVVLIIWGLVEYSG